MIPIPTNEYKEALRDAICTVCVSFTPDKQNPSQCLHESSGQCSLFAKLGEVVEVVSRVNSGSLEPYIDQVRRDICAKCNHQDERGVCDVRDSRGPVPTWCVLDSYLNLIVGAIEDVQQRHQ
jgi:hypothetical protein